MYDQCGFSNAVNKGQAASANIIIINAIKTVEWCRDFIVEVIKSIKLLELAIGLMAECLPNQDQRVFGLFFFVIA